VNANYITGREEEEASYGQNQEPYTPPPMGPNANFTSPQDYYPQSNSFPPPPGNTSFGPTEYAPYNPADYHPQAAGIPRSAAPQPDQRYSQYTPTDTYAGDMRFDPPPTHEQNYDSRYRGPQNVSADPGPSTVEDGASFSQLDH